MNENLELFTSRGQVLICILQKPGITIKDLSISRFLTRRTVWGIIGELRGLGYLVIKKEGKEHHYSVSLFGLSELKNLLKE